MIKTTLPAKRAIAEIVKSYRRMQRKRGRVLSLRDFSRSLSAVLIPLGRTISHQSVRNWEKQVHLPDQFIIRLIAEHAGPGWQQDFGRDVLAALDPETHAPATEIGMQALEKQRETGRSAGKHNGRAHPPGMAN
jgi:hypothetical protein